MSETGKNYKCRVCGEDWGFYPEDFDYNESLYPKICPLCNMPMWQMIKDVFKKEGIKEVFKMLMVRIKNRNKYD